MKHESILIRLTEMSPDEFIFLIQNLYPQIYFHCHQKHGNKTTNEQSITDRDISILVHIATKEYKLLTQLADHLNLSMATLSEATSKLEYYGYIDIQEDPEDKRKRKISITLKGKHAIQQNSVLSYEKLEEITKRLSTHDMEQISSAFKLLIKRLK